MESLFSNNKKIQLKMRLLINVYFLLLTVNLFGQKNDDSKIIINLRDSIGIKDRIKIALVKNNFIVKEDGIKDTISTYPREFNTLPGYSIIKAELNGNTVVLSGAYGLKTINDWGYTTSPKKYKPIVYYKGSKGWRLLMQIANEIGGNLSFSK